MSTAAAFVMPFYYDSEEALAYARRSVQSIVDQSDPDWYLVIVDDGSPLSDSEQRLHELRSMSPDRITVLRQESNLGQGVARNIAVEWADHRGSPFVLFQDSDDVAHPRRLEVTKGVFDGRQADFVYSTFTVIDARGNAVPQELIAPSVYEILEAHRDNPPQGMDCWITIAAQTGYLTLTSTVSVSTARALRNPFPDARGSEDGHAFLRMSADGAVFSYQPSIPAKYRIHADSTSARLGRPLIWTGSAERSDAENDYHATKLRVDSDGFEQACVLAVARGALSDSDVPGLREQFRQRIIQTINREGPGGFTFEWNDRGLPDPLNHSTSLAETFTGEQ